MTFTFDATTLKFGTHLLLAIVYKSASIIGIWKFNSFWDISNLNFKQILKMTYDLDLWRHDLEIWHTSSVSNCLQIGFIMGLWKFDSFWDISNLNFKQILKLTCDLDLWPHDLEISYVYISAYFPQISHAYVYTKIW